MCPTTHLEVLADYSMARPSWRSASCVSSSAELQWVAWREVDTEGSGGTYWMKEHEDVTGKGHKHTQV